MAVYVDEIRTYNHGPHCLRAGSSHMWADSVEELHAMAAAIGMKREWFQTGGSLEHYDLTPRRRAKALQLGATYRPLREFLRERMEQRRQVK